MTMHRAAHIAQHTICFRSSSSESHVSAALLIDSFTPDRLTQRRLKVKGETNVLVKAQGREIRRFVMDQYRHPNRPQRCKEKGFAAIRAATL